MSNFKKFINHPYVQIIGLCVACISVTTAVTTFMYGAQLKAEEANHNQIVIGLNNESKSIIRSKDFEIQRTKYKLEQANERLLQMANSSQLTERTSYRYILTGELFGDPYIHLEAYLNNPPDSIGRPTRKEKPYYKISCNKTPAKIKKDILEVKSGVHSIDIYVGFPGNNPAKLDIKLVKVSNHGDTLILDAYYKTDHGPSEVIGTEVPSHMKSIVFGY